MNIFYKEVSLMGEKMRWPGWSSCLRFDACTGESNCVKALQGKPVEEAGVHPAPTTNTPTYAPQDHEGNDL